MKIAFTGTSSTGKTTLAKALVSEPDFARTIPEFLTADARTLLDALGFSSMDRMSRSELRDFQHHYFRHKTRLEQATTRFVTDRSFVDVAAYWMVRDAHDLSPSERQPFVDACRTSAAKYTIHFYFPTGMIPFEYDAYRSRDLEFHDRIDSQIRGLLEQWNIGYIVMDARSLDDRVRRVIEWTNKANADAQTNAGAKTL